MRVRWTSGLWVGMVASVAVLAHAGPGKSVRITTYQELAEGQAQGVLIGSRGELRSGFLEHRLAMPSPAEDSVRALAVGRDGQVFLGSGGDAATVLVVRPGRGIERLSTLDAGTWVTALCPLESGGVLAGTAQDGRIFRVSPDGKATLAGEVAGEHIWAMVRDAEKKVTYVATGPGRLWALDDGDGRGGKGGRKIFETDTKHFLSLDRGDDGALYVGTADDAVLYRVEPGGSARALHDFAGNEVRAIGHVGDTLYVAVNDMARGDVTSRPTKVTLPPAGTAPGVKATPAAGSSPPSNPSPVEKKGKGALFRLDRQGRVEQLAAIGDGFFNGLTVDQAGNVWAAASAPGGRARLYWVTPDRTLYIAAEVKESDGLTVATSRDGKTRLFGTGNAGALYQLESQGRATSRYLSKAIGGVAPSLWGKLRLQGDGGVVVETRSGNLVRPDKSWSDWQPLQETRDQPTTSERVGQVASPPGRFVQVRLTLAEQAVVRDLTIHHQPVNLLARLTEVQVGEDPSGRVAKGAKPSGALRLRSPMVKLRWKVENPDEDELSYRVYLRRVETTRSGGTTPEGSNWLRILGPEALQKTEHEWNSETVADGMYELRVVASDDRSNPPERALSHEFVTPTFVVDNKRPEITGLRYDRSTHSLHGRASDATSPLGDLSVVIDGNEILPMQTVDGVLDDLSEDFSMKLPPLAKGLHTVLVRASDGADNVGSAQLMIQVD